MYTKREYYKYNFTGDIMDDLAQFACQNWITVYVKTSLDEAETLDLM